MAYLLIAMISFSAGALFMASFRYCSDYFSNPEICKQDVHSNVSSHD